MEADHWRDILRPAYEGRRFIICVDVLAGVSGSLRFLEDLGAERPFIIAAARGIGDVPGHEDADIAMIEADGGSTMTWLRNVEAAMHDLPADVVAGIDAWDPDHRAQVLGPFLFGDAPVAGRPMYGARPAQIAALEDKLTVDDLWDRAGVPRAPRAVVPLAGDAVAAAAAELDWGGGTVWAGDNKAGWHGGAEILRWVADPSQAAAARDFLEDHCDRVRVMPFLEGIPCSIHGMVFPGAVIAVRPIEMLTLRVPDEGRMKYVGTAHFYDPPPGERERMRDIASNVGALLREEVDYKGAFTIDGVMTEQGFLPTELNPRLGAGLLRAVRGIVNLPLLGIHRALVEGEDLDYRPRALERLLVDGADAHRNGVAFVMIDEMPAEPERLFVVFDEDGCGEVETAADADVVIEWGFGTEAGALMVRFATDRTPRGPSVGPRTATALEYAAQRFGLSLDRFEPARDVVRS